MSKKEKAQPLAKIKKKSSLKTVLSAMTGLIFLVLVSVLVIIAYISEYNAVEKAYLNQLRNFNQEVNRQVEDLYNSTWKAVDFFVKNKRIINNIKTRRYKDISDLFKHYASTWDGYDVIFYSEINEDPRILASSKDETLGVRLGNKGFTENLEMAMKGEKFVSPVVLIPYSLNKITIPIFMFTYPVIINDRKAGIIGVALDFSKYLQPIVKNVKIGNSGYTYILDNKRFQMMANPDEDQVLKFYETTTWAEKIKKSTNENDVITYLKFGKEWKLTFKENKKNGYITCSVIEENDIRSAAVKSSKNMVILGFAVLILGIFLIVIYITKKLKLLGELTDASVLLGEQKFDEGISKLDHTKWVHDEVGVLGGNFKNMGVRLKDALFKLEAKIDLANENLRKAHDELKSKHQETLENQEKIKKMNDELKSAHDQIWGEMQLAKKIQTVLLPDDPNIRGYHISAYMKPADDVGGDYYDVINVEGVDWIVIGDVSGHGVPAGLIMMMVQTSIKSVLNQNAGLKPSELLVHINKTISDNIKRLGENKYMTMTVFATIEDGVFHFSGLHQNILIYKNKLKELLIKETSGMWIGIVDDLKGMMDDSSLQLEKGDTMLLYTDGLTEAVDKDDRMFSEEKLMDMFKANGEKTPEEMKDILLRELEDYRCDDDVTMMIIKRDLD